MMQRGNPLLRKTTSLQTEFVQHVGMGVAFSTGHRVRQHILGNRRPTTDVGMGSNAHELMHRTECTNHRPLLNGDMTCQCGGIDQHRVIADEAIVPYMCIGHDENMAANASDAAALCSPAVDSDTLADDVVVAHLQPRCFPREANVLWIHA